MNLTFVMLYVMPALVGLMLVGIIYQLDNLEPND